MERTNGRIGSGCWIEALSVRSDHYRTAGCRIRGVTVVLGEMGVARAKPKTPATRDAPLQPAAAVYCPAGSPRPPLFRWTTSTRPGARRALGDGDDVWRGQTEGSVDARDSNSRPLYTRISVRSRRELLRSPSPPYHHDLRNHGPSHPRESTTISSRTLPAELRVFVPLLHHHLLLLWRRWPRWQHRYLPNTGLGEPGTDYRCRCWRGSGGFHPPWNHMGLGEIAKAYAWSLAWS